MHILYLRLRYSAISRLLDRTSPCISERITFHQSPFFPGNSVVKNTPAMQESWVQSLGREDLLKKEMATHTNILAWEIPWTEVVRGAAESEMIYQ